MNVPKLRFKEFDGEFRYERTGKFFKYIRNGFVGTATPYYTNETGVKYLQSNNIKNGEISAHNPIYITREFHNKHKKNELQLNDLLMVQSGVFTGECAVVNEEHIGENCHALIIMTPNNSINTQYLNYYLHSYQGKKELHRYITGQTIQHILSSDMKKIIFPYTQKEEQTKIADFLMLLDKKIQLQQQKIDLLQEQKKGFLQKMFPKNGETVPELRFDGFTGDWKEQKLREIGKTQSGIGFPDVEQGGSEGVPFFKVSDMNIAGNEYEMITSNNYVSDEQLKRKKWRPIETVPAVIFAKVGAAIMLNRKRLVRTPFLIDNNTMAYVFDESWDTDFGKILFETVNLPKYAQVGALPSYNGSDIENIEVKVTNKDEQVKIGLFFNRLEHIINLHQHKLDLLEKQKKGFMQQMFI